MSIFSICATAFTDKPLEDILRGLWESTGLAGANSNTLLEIAMMLVAALLFFLAIAKKFEPNLLLGIAFGAFIINIPGAYRVLMAEPTFSVVTENGVTAISTVEIGGLFY